MKRLFRFIYVDTRGQFCCIQFLKRKNRPSVLIILKFVHSHKFISFVRKLS
jgi:hypothetical protein